MGTPYNTVYPALLSACVLEDDVMHAITTSDMSLIYTVENIAESSVRPAGLVPLRCVFLLQRNSQMNILFAR